MRNGEVWSTGSGECGQLASGELTDRSTFAPAYALEGHKVAAVSCGGLFTAVLPKNNSGSSRLTGEKYRDDPRKTNRAPSRPVSQSLPQPLTLNLLTGTTLDMAESAHIIAHSKVQRRGSMVPMVQEKRCHTHSLVDERTR